MKVPFRAYLTLLARYLRPQWPKALLLAGLLGASITLQLVNPQIMRAFIDTASGGGSIEALRQTPIAPLLKWLGLVSANGEGGAFALSPLLAMGILFMAVALVQQLIAVWATYTGEDVGWASTNALRNDLAEHLLALDMSFHNAHTPGEMIERLDGDVAALTNFFSQFVIQVLGSGILLVGVLALLWREDWRVGAVFGVFMALAFLLMGKLRDACVPAWEGERGAAAGLFGFLEERLAGTEDIRACGAKPYVMRRFFELLRAWMRKTIRATVAVNALINITDLLFALGNASAFLLGAYLYRAGEITIGSVYIIFYYSNMLAWPIERITFQMQDLQRAGAGITRVRELLLTQSKVARGGTGEARRGTARTLPKGALAVAFEGVSFGYDDAVGRPPSPPPSPGVPGEGAKGSEVGAVAASPSPGVPGEGAKGNEVGAVTTSPSLGVPGEGAKGNEVGAVAASPSPGVPGEGAKGNEVGAVAASPSPGVSGEGAKGNEVGAVAASPSPGVPGEGGGEGADATAPKEMVLHDLSFHVSPGKVLGLLGRTGSGKTTVTRLLFRLYDVDRGAILLGGQGAGEVAVDLRELDEETLRAQVGMVTQSIQLFHASVRDNLTFFDPAITDESILQAIHELGLGKWFGSLPNGLDTVLESGGGGLSAGEAQLLAFTRIFLRDPGLVVLDEASSRLDPATEQLIERAVDRLVANRTAIIIAHRLGTVQRADDILILEEGCVCEYGERAQLAADPSSRFHHLLQTGLEEVLV